MTATNTVIRRGTTSSIVLSEKEQSSLHDTPLISMCVAIYNTEKYLRKCLDTIINQTYKNLDIILVDDCSTDGSGRIADEYAKKDNRVKVIHHPENQGFSGARNTGLENATGDYVSFVDSDDYCEPDYIAYLYGIIEQTGSDIALSRHFFTSRFHQQVETDRITTITSEDMLCDIFYNRIHVGVWNLLYKKELLEGKRFRLLSKTGEDMQFNTQLIPGVKSVGVGLRRIYTYNVDNENSATRKPNIEKQALGSIENMDYIKANLSPSSERLDKAVEYQYFTTALYALNHLVMANGGIREHKDFYRYLVNYCKKTAPKTFAMKISKKQMLKSMLVWISPVLAVRLFILWRRKLGIKQRG
ncbi:MAG: glycosyltransferase [Synergistaceae bacterium]|jgi:glycosyltransferase involved in cell wall biosynthesis|nr:glycosyltransferase [Synergistaceae bacterium]